LLHLNVLPTGCGVDTATDWLAALRFFSAHVNKWFAVADVACLELLTNLSVPGKINILLYFVVCTYFVCPYKRNERCRIEIKSRLLFESVPKLMVRL
jgi:hypothetical protein